VIEGRIWNMEYGIWKNGWGPKAPTRFFYASNIPYSTFSPKSGKMKA